MKNLIHLKIISLVTALFVSSMTFTMNTEGIFLKNNLVDNNSNEMLFHADLTIIEIIQPRQNIMYINGIPLKICSLIIGNITVLVTATSLFFIDKIEFYIDNELKHTEENRLTWLLVSWEWDETIFFKHNLKVVAYDKSGGTSTDEMDLWIFNF